VKAGWALLRRRDFGLLWAGGLISETGDWFLLVGRTLVAVSLAQAAFLLPLLAVDGRNRLWIVYLVMAVEAALAQLNDPARNALVPSLVARADLVGANALIGLNSNLARLVGSPLGGIMVEVAGLPGLVVADAASFLLGAALIALVRSDAGTSRAGGADPAPDVVHSPRPGPRRAGVVREWVDGLRVTLGDRGLRWGLVVNGLAGVAQGIFTVLFVLFVTRVLGGDGADVGLLRGVQAIGGLLGGVLVVGLATRLEAGRLLGVSLLVFAAIDLAIWNGPLLTTADWLYLALFVAAGIPGVGVLTGLTSLVQERTAEAYLGRVFATYLGSFNGLMALGMLLAGLLGDTLGVVAVLNAQAGLGLLAGLIAVATLGRRVPRERYPRASKRVRMPLA
jgi:predicted MFS family arabinose efflux permease